MQKIGITYASYPHIVESVIASLIPQKRFYVYAVSVPHPVYGNEGDTKLTLCISDVYTNKEVNCTSHSKAVRLYEPFILYR